MDTEGCGGYYSRRRVYGETAIKWHANLEMHKFNRENLVGAKTLMLKCPNEHLKCLIGHE